MYMVLVLRKKNKLFGMVYLYNFDINVYRLIDCCNYV